MRWPIWVTVVSLAVAPAALAAKPKRATRFAELANRCFTVAGKGFPGDRFYVKPTGIGTMMLSDTAGRLLSADGTGRVDRIATPGKAAELSAHRARGRTFLLRATDDGRELGRFSFTRARGCRPYPEAGLDAKGKPRFGKLRDGTVFGFADAHLHVTADLRAGGAVISGKSFDEFGV